MNDVTDIAAARRRRYAYRKALHQVARELRELEGQVFELTVKLAVAGPLRVWDEQQEVGSFARIDEQFLADTGDPRVLALLALKERIYEAVIALYEEAPKK